MTGDRLFKSARHRNGLQGIGCKEMGPFYQQKMKQKIQMSSSDFLFQKKDEPMSQKATWQRSPPPGAGGWQCCGGGPAPRRGRPASPSRPPHRPRGPSPCWSGMDTWGQSWGGFLKGDSNRQIPTDAGMKTGFHADVSPKNRFSRWRQIIWLRVDFLNRNEEK